jgi:hypothetical protein
MMKSPLLLRTLFFWLTVFTVFSSSAKGFFSVTARRHRSFTCPCSCLALLCCNHSSEQEALQALERLSHLDEKLGVNCGAAKERARLTKIVESWMQAVEEDEDADEDDFNDGEDDEEDNEMSYNDGVYIDRHGSGERVAIFGGDPVRRRQYVEKRLQPYQSLEQFGTPRDVGSQDQRDLCRKIRRNSFDVVYIWTRFGNHNSRNAIRDACRKSTNNTRCIEIESLSRIRKA